MSDVQTTVTHLDGLLAQYRHIASTDDMTGLYNRNASERRLTEEIARATREGHGFMFCFLDLNGFKSINDQHGHAFGDRVLAHVSSILARSLRQGDWCGRWGGDEFVLVLFASRAVQDAVFQRIGAELKARPLPLEDGSVVQVSLSCGACHYQPGSAMATLLERADQAMYRAKKEAGTSNLRVVFDPLPPPVAS